MSILNNIQHAVFKKNTFCQFLDRKNDECPSRLVVYIIHTGSLWLYNKSNTFWSKSEVNCVYTRQLLLRFHSGLRLESCSVKRHADFLKLNRRALYPYPLSYTVGSSGRLSYYVSLIYYNTSDFPIIRFGWSFFLTDKIFELWNKSTLVVGSLEHCCIVND